MKVTKEMLDESLRSYLFLLRALTPFFKYKPLTKFVDSLKTRGRGENAEGLKCEEAYVPSSDGSHSIRVRIYRPLNSDGELPAMLYLHGGGYIMGCPEGSGDLYRDIIGKRPCVIIAPDYRKAYTKPYPGAFDDSYDTLLWLQDNAASLGVYPDRIMVAGHSAGGGLTAAVTLKARDTGDANIAFQMPIYPMIDDQQPYDPEQGSRFLWLEYRCQPGCMECLPGGFEKAGCGDSCLRGTERATQITVASRPTITFVGSLEPFYWETVAYVEALEGSRYRCRL